MKAKLFFSFLTVCFLFIFQSESVFASNNTITVNDSNILNAADHTVSCGGGTAVYDADTKTLTLDNAVINTDSNGNLLLKGIDIQEEGVTVELKGDNTINAHYGIASTHPFTIKGISGGRLTINTSQVLSGNNCRGIFIEGGGLTVRDASLQINIGHIGADHGYAIYIHGNDNLISNSHISITTQSGPSYDPRCNGISAINANSLTISDGSSIVMEKIDDGITASGNLTISGSRLSINTADRLAVSSDNIVISNGAEITSAANTSQALHANNKITISNSSVNTNSKKNNGILCHYLEVSDSSTITSQSYYCAVWAVNQAVVRNSSLNTVAEDDISFFSNGSVEFADSDVKAANGIYANGDISITGGKTEIGDRYIKSDKDIHIGGTITSNGIPSFSGIITNTGDISFSDADYSAVDRAIAKAESLDKNKYSNFEIVEEAVKAVVRGKDIREQAVVDGYASAIETAISSLKSISDPQKTYRITEGANQTIYLGGDKNITIKSDGDFDKFVSVSMDGKEISKEHYTAEAGSTIITLKSEYLNTLAIGTHKFVIHYEDGQAETTLNLKKQEDSSSSSSSNQKPEGTNRNPFSPETGDSVPIGLLIFAFGFSFTVILFVRRFQTRR